MHNLWMEAMDKESRAQKIEAIQRWVVLSLTIFGFTQIIYILWGMDPCVRLGFIMCMFRACVFHCLVRCSGRSYHA